jgi:predicted DNA-binding protein (UPF0251 family)
MPRPRRCLCAGIKFHPNTVFFKPQGILMRDLEIVVLSLEEIESYRLRHVDNLEQIEAAKRMHTSQSTYQRVLDSAYKKIADALINGKAINIIKH